MNFRPRHQHTSADLSRVTRMKHAASNINRLLAIFGLVVVLTGCGEDKEADTSPTPAPIGNSSSSPTSSAASVSSSANVSSTPSAPPPSSAANSSVSSVINTGTLLKWSHPSQRENGEYLELDEIGGYELRYRQNTQAEFAYVVIPGSRTTSYAINSQQIGYQFEISTYDDNGLYSEFVPISAQ